MRIKEAFDLYKHYEILSLSYSQNTAKCYDNACKIAIKYLGNIKVEKITLDAVKDFYLNMLENHSQDSARQYLAKLRVIIRFCRSRGIKTINPDDIKTPRAEKKSARFLTNQQYEQFLNYAKQARRGYARINRLRNEIIIEMLYHTGLRVGELCALDRSSIHDRQFVVIGKSKEPRVCFITRQIEIKLNNYINLRADNSDALFVANQNGKRITPHNIQDIFRKISKRSGIIATPHTMRHSFATRLIEDGVDIRYVAAFLGHQSLQTTQRYTHIRNAKLYEIYNLVMERG